MKISERTYKETVITSNRQHFHKLSYGTVFCMSTTKTLFMKIKGVSNGALDLSEGTIGSFYSQDSMVVYPLSGKRLISHKN